MKKTGFFFAFLAILLVGGFAYLAFADISVKTASVAQTIPNERFFDAR